MRHLAFIVGLFLLQVSTAQVPGTPPFAFVAKTKVKTEVVVCRHYWQMSYCTKPDGSCFSHNDGVTDSAKISTALHYGVPTSEVIALTSFTHHPQPGWNSSCGSIGGWRQWQVTLP